MTDMHLYGIRGTPPFYAELYPCIAIVARGKLLDWWIYKHYKAFNVVAKCYVTDNPRTDFQQAWRAYFYFGVKNWQGFTDEIKRYYNKKSKYRFESGYNRYLSMYLRANYPPEVPEAGFLLMSTGEYLLLSDGGKIILS